MVLHTPNARDTGSIPDSVTKSLYTMQCDRKKKKKKKKNFTINSFSHFKLYLQENTYITISLSFRFLFKKIPKVKDSTYSLKPKINVE